MALKKSDVKVGDTTTQEDFAVIAKLKEDE
jgi:hypothetical protein